MNPVNEIPGSYIARWESKMSGHKTTNHFPSSYMHQVPRLVSCSQLGVGQGTEPIAEPSFV